MAGKEAKVVIRGEDKSRHAFRSVHSNLRALRGFAAPAAAAITALSGAAGMEALVKSSFKSVDALAKLSDRLGISTKAMAGLQHAASLTGVENSTLETGLRSMIKNIGDFSNGTGEAKTALEGLGFAQGELSKMAPDQQFSAIAQAMASIKNPTERVSTAYKIFGGRASDLLNTLDLGADGLKKATEEADKLGLAVSRVDAAKIEAANDAWERMGGAIQGIGNTFAIALAGPVEKFANGFSQWVGEFHNAERAAAFMAKVGPSAAPKELDAARAGLISLQSEIGKVAAAGGSLETLTGIYADQVDLVRSLKEEVAALAATQAALPKISPVDLTGSPETGSAAKLTEQERDAMDARLESVRTSLMSEEQALQESFLRRVEIVTSAYDNGLIPTEERAQGLIQKLAGDHQAALTEIAKRGAVDRAAEDQKAWAQQKTAAMGNMVTVLGAFQGNSKKLFAAQKLASVSFGLLSQKEAIIDAYKWGTKTGGPWLGAAFAAMAVAATAAPLASLKSASLGGGGGESTGAGGGSGGGTNIPPPVAMAPESSPLIININGIAQDGTVLMNDSDLRELIERIYQAGQDGIARQFG